MKTKQKREKFGRRKGVEKERGWKYEQGKREEKRERESLYIEKKIWEIANKERNTKK